MKATLHVSIAVEGEKDGIDRLERIARKTVEMPFACPGMDLESSAWEHPRRVVAVQMNIDSQSLYLYLQNEEVVGEVGRDHAVRHYKEHGWTVTES